ncbi:MULTISPECIES: phosphopantetheine-binding protein [Kitasatospora]|uniref:Carrier domain-containing protein n=1 Tax=Kitasatospora cystarginea TaxID=58350 RepID=A0ABN3EBN5_9ACTN
MSDGFEPLTREMMKATVPLGEEPTDIPDDDELQLLGPDSIRLMHLVERWHRAGLELSFVELAERRTLAEWWDLLSTRLPRGSQLRPGHDRLPAQ